MRMGPMLNEGCGTRCTMILIRLYFVTEASYLLNDPQDPECWSELIVANSRVANHHDFVILKEDCVPQLSRSYRLEVCKSRLFQS